jgi:thiol-disulfide isomerase/thioredoxin
MDMGKPAEVLYTGKDLLYTMPNDSTAIIRSTNIWAEDLKRTNFQYRYFDPLMSCKSFPFLDETGKLLNGSLVNYMGNESILQTPCYHIQIIRDTKNFPVVMKWRVLSMVYDYWIRTSDSIPIQYIVSSKHLIVNDTLNQYEKYNLNKYDLNQALNDSIFTLKSIPAFYKLRNITRTDEPNQLLLTDSIAPEWSLTSLNNEKISLSNYRGKVVLIDFFYQSCYPCRLAIPALISLYTKYKEKGLVVIGIDPVDKRNTGNWNELTAFLSKRQVNYPILLDDEDVARKYKVRGYPTIYLIDKRGKILFSISGYGPILDTQLEYLISKAL